MGRVEQRIEHFEIALSGDAERHLDAMGAECGNDQLAAAEKSLVRRHHCASINCYGSHLRRCRRRTKGCSWTPGYLRTAKPIIG